MGYRLFSVAVILIFVAHSCAPQKPKNVIIMISDGCGYNQIDAASLYQYGQTGTQVYEQFPVKYGISTYPIDGIGYNPDSIWASFDYVRRKPTDSGAASTALNTGVKTKRGYIGLDSADVPLENIGERFEKYGKATGVVTSVQWSHATPAGAVVHNISRGNNEEIAAEMLTKSRLEVIMGCGHPYYDDDGKIAVDTLIRFVGGQATWDALEEGNVGNDCDGDDVDDKWVLIQDKEAFRKLAGGETPKRVIGVPEVRYTLQQGRSGDRNAEPFAEPLLETVPSLADMVRGALNVLDNDPDGFFLMIEGGAIDWACHGNQSGREIEEEIDFNHAVEAVVNWIKENSSWNETLLIVTADHETGYLTGPGSNDSSLTKDATIVDRWKPLVNNGKGKQPGMEWHSGGHTNSLVPFFAKGAGSRKFADYEVGVDPVRGKYIDNISIAKMVFSWYPEMNSSRNKKERP